MRKNKSVIAVLLVSLFICVNSFTFSVYAESSGIAIELDKTQAKVGDVIKATIKISNIENFSGYQVNLRYNPEVLEAVDPDNGEKYNESTIPGKGTVLLNDAFSPLPMVDNLPSAGILNFGKSYLNLQEYKKSGKPENSGILAIIGFKVIKDAATEIMFEDLGTMPNSNEGTLLFNWDSKQIGSYKVSFSPKINPSSEAAPMPAYTHKGKPVDSSTKTNGVTFIVIIAACIILLVIVALVFLLRNDKGQKDENYEQDGAEPDENEDGSDSDADDVNEPSENEQKTEEDNDK